jgi:hypothetical protein
MRHSRYQMMPYWSIGLLQRLNGKLFTAQRGRLSLRLRPFAANSSPVKRTLYTSDCVDDAV